MIRACLSVAPVATFVGLLTILHVLEPQMNSGHLISEYQLTRHGWMMSLAFCSFGVSAMLVAYTWRSRGLGLIGLARFTAGMFPPIQNKPVVAWVHGVSGVVTIFGAPIVFVLVGRRCADRFLRGATALAWAGLLAFALTLVFAGRAVAESTTRLHPAISISNRLMVATYCLWFAIAAWRGLRDNRDGTPPRAPSRKRVETDAKQRAHPRPPRGDPAA
jgi:hypothetical protein